MGVPGLIIGGLGVVGNLIGAKKGADASKKAAKMQQSAADKALQYQREERDRMMAMHRPFVEGMGDRMNTLRSLTTPGMRYGQPPMPPQQNMAGPMPGSMPPPNMMGPQHGRGPMPHPMNPGAGQPMTLGAMRQPMQMNPDPYTQYLMSRQAQ